MKNLITLFLLISFGFIQNTGAKENKLDVDFLASLINDVKTTAKLPSGTAVVVVHNDRLIYQGNFGYQDIENHIPVNANTRFYLASVTKTFTALNYLLDARKRRSFENVTLKEMFPKMTLTGREEVTIKELLTHTASINNSPLVLATAYSGEHTLNTLENLVAQSSINSEEPVGEFKYTNVGYNIYSVYSDRIFGQSWQKKLKSQVFEPAKMDSTSATRSTIEDQQSIAKPYSLANETRQAPLYLEKNDSTMHAAGGMFSTALDIGRFLIAQMNKGVIDGKQVYPSDVIARSQTRQVKTDASYLDFKRDGYAWGWYTGDYRNQRMLHHFGGFAGTHAHMSFMPDHNIGLVVLNNENFLSARLTSIIADYVYGSILGENDVKDRIMQRVELLKSKLVELDDTIAKQRKEILGREWLLSLPLQAYVGEYKDPLLGSVFVTQNKEQRFDVEWGVMRSDSTGMGDPDKIRVELEPTSGSVITFNIKDKVQSLTYSGIEFIKQ